MTRLSPKAACARADPPLPRHSTAGPNPLGPAVLFRGGPPPRMALRPFRRSPLRSLRLCERPSGSVSQCLRERLSASPRLRQDPLREAGVVRLDGARSGDSTNTRRDQPALEHRVEDFAWPQANSSTHPTVPPSRSSRPSVPPPLLRPVRPLRSLRLCESHPADWLGRDSLAKPPTTPRQEGKATRHWGGYSGTSSTMPRPASPAMV